MDVAHDERDGLFAATLAFAQEMALKTEDTELSPAGGEIGLGYLLDLRFGHCTHNYILLDWITGRGEGCRGGFARARDELLCRVVLPYACESL